MENFFPWSPEKFLKKFQKNLDKNQKHGIILIVADEDDVWRHELKKLKKLLKKVLTESEKYDIINIVAERYADVV